MDYRYQRYLRCMEVMPEPAGTSSPTYGRGIINSMINNLPFEMHMPGYNYLGPGTKLEKRLNAGSQPINKLDELAMNHDIAYSKSKNLDDRHAADYNLQEGAWNRVLADDAGLGEKAVAWLTTNAMKAKRALGAGLLTKYPVSLEPAEQEKLAAAIQAQKGVSLKVSTIRTKESVMSESYLPLTKSQIANLKKGGNSIKTIRLSSAQVEKVKSGGYLKTILQYGPAAIGAVSALVDLFKSKEKDGKGVYINKKPRGSGVYINKKPKSGEGVYINKKPKGSGVYINKKPKSGEGVYINKKPKGNGLLDELLKKKKLLL
ncbi:uncharacterized protein LOC135836595 [Planococcus citri]|uniref:uncharacterized protein LOC135836595 n=1 Tax=Planococcus citri TaxID=170843 RepID=UPI0031F936C5